MQVKLGVAYVCLDFELLVIAIDIDSAALDGQVRLGFELEGQGGLSRSGGLGHCILTMMVLLEVLKCSGQMQS